MSDVAIMVLDLETVPDTQLPQPEDVTKFPAPPLHRVVCAGWALLGADYLIQAWEVALAATPDKERGLLETLIELVDQHDPVVVTMNGRGFDLPVIASRGFVHGLSWPWYYRKRYGARYRYSKEETYDVMDHLADHGGAPKAGLDVWAKACGWPGKRGGVSGSKVAEMAARGEMLAIADYNLEDVCHQTAVLLRAELLRGVLSLEEYQAAAQALLDHAEGDHRTAGLALSVDRARFLCKAPEGDRRLDDAEQAAEQDWRDLPAESEG